MKNENFPSKFNAYCRRFCIMLIDLALFFFCNVCIVYLTMGGHVLATNYTDILFDYTHLIITCIITLLINTAFGLYRSVWTFAGTDEIPRNFIASALSSAALFIIDRFLYHKLFHSNGYLPFYAYILMFVLLFISVCAPRIGYRVLRRMIHETGRYSKNQKRVMIVGAGFMGNYIIDNLASDGFRTGYPVIAVDDNPAKKGKRINGVKVKGTCEEIPEIADKHNIDIIIICLPSASQKRQKEIIDIAMQTKCAVKISPSITEFIEGDKTRRNVRDVEIKDLLARAEVTLDKKVCHYLLGETILVTGGGGSIGSEICRQAARYHPKTIVIFDIYENCAFELQNKLRDKYGDEIDIEVRIGSVRDMDRLAEIFEEFHPDVVFHAAAHKHVPLMEDSPCEAVKNNVFGTYNVAVTADKFKVPKMVILSTDKAVNPTNVMGCTKRITEIIVQYMNKKSENTEYAAVRFGNVLGSHGSVIPIFKDQIANGGPITLTHPDIERYFMTIPEAAQLVCQAGGLAKGGEIFVLDMGEPVKIMDLAKNLIRLSGYSENEIEIKITGLRPGEKMYEELAMESEMETRSKTALEKIYVTQPMDIDDAAFESMLADLHDVTDNNVREKLMKIVPNYHPAEN